MTSKEKAKELVDKFLPYSYYHEMDNSMNRNYQQEDNAKQCALICVNEIIDSSKEYFKNTTYDEYWEEVLTEIDNL